MSDTPDTSKVSKDKETKRFTLFKTSSPLLQMRMPDGGIISFGKHKLYRAVNEIEEKFLKIESELRNPVLSVSEDQDADKTAFVTPGDNKELRASQIRQFLAQTKNGQGPEVDAGNSPNGPQFKTVSTADSPLTGGVNAASQRFKQADVAAVLKSGKILTDK